VPWTKLQISVPNLQCAFGILFDAHETNQLDGLHRRWSLFARSPMEVSIPAKEQSDRNKNPRVRLECHFILLVLNSSVSNERAPNMRETSSVGGPLTPRSHNRRECPVSFGREAETRYGRRFPGHLSMPSISPPLELKTSVIPSVYRTTAVIGLELYFQCWWWHPQLRAVRQVSCCATRGESDADHDGLPSQGDGQRRQRTSGVVAHRSWRRQQ